MVYPVVNRPNQVEIPNLEFEVKNVLYNVYENQSQAVQSKSDSVQSTSGQQNLGEINEFLDQNIET